MASIVAASGCRLTLTPFSVGHIDNNSSSVCDRIRPPLPCPKVPMINDQRRFSTIKCHASSKFPYYTRVPKIKYHSDDSSTYDFQNGLYKNLYSCFGRETENRQLYTLGLRMTIRDEDGALEKRLAPWAKLYYDWKFKTGTISQFLQLEKLTPSFKDISSCLLENADSWICGYSFVLYEKFNYKFGLELLKLEPVLSLYASGGYTRTNVRSTEIFLMAEVYGTIRDHNIHTREQLIDLLRQLNNRKRGTDLVFRASVVPMVFTHFVAKERLDQLKGYAHLCLGNFP